MKKINDFKFVLQILLQAIVTSPPTDDTTKKILPIDQYTIINY